MLTCKVGTETINTIDYIDDQIRKWSKKGILKCPICDGELIYKNGEFKIAHFAHKDGDDCVDIIGYERDTEEHLNAISDLYKRLKAIELFDSNLRNIELEYWIPSTRQRGDISFIYKDQRYIIEMQCSPISSKYMERHRLYELSGIKDIWILGAEKYEDNKTVDGYFKTKEIERQLLYQENQNLLYYNYKTKLLSNMDKNQVDALLDRKTAFKFVPFETELDNINIDEIVSNTNIINNKQVILKWFDLNVKDLCCKVNFNYYVKLLDRKVLIYFEINKTKYIIDYLNYYVNANDFKKVIREYKDTKFVPLLFLNYGFYKHGIKEGMMERDGYWEYKDQIKWVCYWRKWIRNLIDDNMIFVDNDNIYMFDKIGYGKNTTDYVPLLNKKLDDINNIHYVRKNKLVNAYEIDVLYAEEIFKEYITELSNDIKYYLKQSLVKNQYKNIFGKYCIDDIILLNNNMICKNSIDARDKLSGIKNEIDLLNLYDTIHNKLQIIIDNGLKENIIKKEKIKLDHIKNKDIFTEMSNKIEHIFNNSKDKVIDYQLGYVFDETIDNVIWFKDYRDKEFIIYSNFYNHNTVDHMVKFSIPNDKQRLIFLNIPFGRNFSDIYIIETNDSYKICDYIPKPSYKYNTNFKKDISSINFSFKRLGDNWYPLLRYNFMNICNLITKVKMDIYEFLDNYVDFYSATERILFIPSTISNDNINENIRKFLYPIIFLSEKNMTNKLNITLNIDFTKDNNGKFKPWLIKDFITSLESIGIRNINNII